jgi:hypothetical protein
MANVDNPNGFYPSRNIVNPSYIPVIQGDLKSGENLAAGDGVIAASGFMSILLSNSGVVMGVLAEPINATSAAATGGFHPAINSLFFHGQCSGTFVDADRYNDCDVEGATTVMEINRGASVEDVVVIYDLYRDPLNAAGANARVEFWWNKSIFAGDHIAM